MALLPGLIGRADIAMFPIDCISHDAMGMVKRQSRLTGTPFVPLRTSSLACLVGGLAAPLNPKRIALLERGVRKLFPGLGPIMGQWLGFRPSLPDSLPVIGPSRASPNVIHALGHGHLGMTLAGVTSRVVAGLIERRNEGTDIEAFRADRF